jgi:hypothetical protein
MRNFSTLARYFVLLTVLLMTLTIASISRVSAADRPSEGPLGAEEKGQSDSIPPCDATSPRSAPGQTRSQNGMNPHSVSLSWTASTPVSKSHRDSIKGYVVYRSQKSQEYSGNNRINLIPLTGTRCVDSTVQAGSTYFYVIKAVAESGSQSVVSKEITAVIPSP